MVLALRAAMLGAIFGLAAAGFISNDVLLSHDTTTGRSLLEGKGTPAPAPLAHCPVNFAAVNYTGLTSQCKAPQYDPAECCPAFLDFACPYAESISNNTTNCAAIMWHHIDKLGKYPKALFANICHGGPHGLECPDQGRKVFIPAAAAPAVATSAATLATPQVALVIVALSVCMLMS